MKTLLFTLLATSIVVLISICLLAIGWLLTGKSRIIRGACGMDPHRLRDQECGKNELECGLCNKNSKKEQSKKEKND